MILIQPPSEYTGNLGDEAMFSALADCLGVECGVLLNKDAFLRPGYRKAKFVHNYDTEFPDIYDEFWYIGGDVVDGVYVDGDNLKHLQSAVERGIPSRVISFSWSENPAPKSKEIISSLNGKASFYPRDEYSYNRFYKDTNISPVSQCSDLAFLLSPIKSFSKYYRPDILEKFLLEDDRTTILATCCYFDWLPLNKRVFIDKLAELLNSLDGIKVILVPHDTRNWSCDYEAIHFLNKKLRHKCYNAYTIDTPSAMQLLCSMVDMVISCRLHLSIFSLTAGTPVAAIDYNDKMSGIFKQFELEGQVATGMAQLQRITQNTLGNLGAISDQIKQNLGFVRQLALRNLDRQP